MQSSGGNQNDYRQSDNYNQAYRQSINSQPTGYYEGQQNPPYQQYDQSDYSRSMPSEQVQFVPAPSIDWAASDGVNRARSSKWYLTAGICFAVAAVLVIILFAVGFLNIFSLISMLVMLATMCVALFVYAKIPNKIVNYSLSPDGIVIDERLHPLSEYRAFGVRQNGGYWQLVLIPVKRFGMETTINIDEQHGEKIVDMLARYMPMEEVANKGLDQLFDKLQL